MCAMWLTYPPGEDRSNRVSSPGGCGVSASRERGSGSGPAQPIRAPPNSDVQNGLGGSAMIDRTVRRSRLASVLALGMAMALGATEALAQEAPAGEAGSAGDKAVAPQTWAWHVQGTDILQYAPSFHSAFAGPQSFQAQGVWGNTIDATLYLGVRPWAGGETWGPTRAMPRPIRWASRAM